MSVATSRVSQIDCSSTSSTYHIDLWHEMFGTRKSDTLRDLQIEAKTRRELITDQRMQLLNAQRKLNSIETSIRLLSSGGNTTQAFAAGGSFTDDGHDNIYDGEDDDNDSYTEDPDESSGIVNPIWDQADGVFRCKECAFEVVDGICQECGTEFKWDLVEVQRLQPAVYTHSDMLNSDRSRVQRGNTPLLDISPAVSIPPAMYYYRAEEFRALLRRGATRLMCETFRLEFSEASGIFGWADEDIYEQFSGPAMQKGDFWKIHLGRRIQLDDDDLDGSMFVEGLLEDVLLYPSYSYTVDQQRKEEWETVEESPGIWVTRLTVLRKMTDSDSEHESTDDEEYEEQPSELRDPLDMYEKALDAPPSPATGPVVTSDEYELSSAEEGEVSEGEVSDVEMMDDSGWAWKAGVPDAVWKVGGEEDKEDIVTELDEHGSTVSPQVDLDDGSSNSDDADSDFDSDEVLSGDEDVLISYRQS